MWKGFYMKNIVYKMLSAIVTLAVIIGCITIGTGTVFAATAPWTKNENGQFVNGNGDIIKGATMKGIDVSHYNGNIDWKTVAESDIDYAIIRCGYGNDQANQDDTYWQQNVKGCEDNNIPYGVYIYSYATTKEMALSEAKHVLRLVDGHKLSFPIYYDVEADVQKKLTKSQITELIDTFSKEIMKQGYECGVYSNLDWWTNRIESKVATNPNYFKWVAQYNNVGTTFGYNYEMWQYTESGTVAGVNGKCDINFWLAPVRDSTYNARNYKPIIEPTTEKPTTKPAVKVTAPKTSTISKLAKGKKSAKISIKKVKGIKGYQIQYSTVKSFKKKNTKTKTTTKNVLTIKKLKSKKVYYFRVKAYKMDGKKKVYSKKWSKVKKVRVK